MKATEFVKKHGWEKSKSTLTNAHHKTTHFYCGWMGLVDYFYKHESLGWCQLDIRTKGWDSDRCTQGIHPPVNAMVSVDELKRLVESHDLVESIGGIEKAILHLIATDRRLGYTHIYLHSNGRYCWLDDYVDYIPDHAISIKSAIKAIADVEACQ